MKKIFLILVLGFLISCANLPRTYTVQVKFMDATTDTLTITTQSNLHLETHSSTGRLVSGWTIHAIGVKTFKILSIK